jgi:hemolysin III
MSAAVPLPSYTPAEQFANAATHGIGIVLAIVGLVVMMIHANARGDAWHVIGCAIFGATMIACFTTSTLYHSISAEHLRGFLRALDHSAIFLLIAGTYTPFMLVNLRGPWGWSLLTVIWTAALVGIVLRLFWRGRFHGVVVGLYLAMGWAVVFAIKPMLDKVAAGGMWLLLAGGLAYTGGVVFYKWKSLPHHHAIWHLFVLLGCGLHYFAVLFHVIPWPAATA